jgi:predicted flap endonuclease-1-like 5' DNA nuclease
MPELTVVHLGLLAVMLIVGVIGGWFLRADRCAKEKIAVSASWQDQLESQQSEHNRLAEQNKSLMEQISQYQASQKDLTNRAKELSDSLKEAFARRDELQRQLKDIRGNLEVAIAQRDRLKGSQNNQDASGQSSALKDKDDKIFRLSRELTSWQSRVPPLVERFQERDKQARQFEEELEQANARLQSLQDLVKSDQTRIEPVDAGSLPDGGDASNEPIAMTSTHDASEIQDQIDDETPEDNTENEEEIADIDAEDESEDETAFAAVFSNEEDSTEEEPAAEFGPASDSEAEGASNEDEAGDEVDDVGNDENEEDDNESSNGYDDLKSIKGIGPSIERTLNELGITQFHQLAEISEGDIDRVAQQLKGFRSRVYREDWIGQARDLHTQKNGGLS